MTAKAIIKKYKKYIVLCVCVILSFALDMITKSCFDNKHFSIIEGLIGIYSCYNTGAAFSSFSGYTTLLAIFSAILAIGLLIFYILIKNDSLLFQIGISLILGGALGNLYDRVALGYVRDFINLEFVDFAVFNIADSCITLGIIAVSIYILFLDGGGNKGTNNTKEGENNGNNG